MAETTKKRVRRRFRRAGRRTPGGASPARGGWSRSPEEPPWGPDGLDGGAGVREPRRPYPGAPAGALALDEPHSELLNLTG